MKESIDDLTNQAIDLVLENDALHKRIVEPLKRKILPYVACGVLTNVVMFILLVYLARRLRVLQTTEDLASSSSSSSSSTPPLPFLLLTP